VQGCAKHRKASLRWEACTYGGNQCIAFVIIATKRPTEKKNEKLQMPGNLLSMHSITVESIRIVSFHFVFGSFRFVFGSDVGAFESKNKLKKIIKHY
jgi:hypothetical protein